MTAQCNSVGSTVLAIALNYLIQKIIHMMLKAQWDGKPWPHSRQHQQQQQQPRKGTVPGKSNLFSPSDRKSQPSITSCEVVLKGPKLSGMWIFTYKWYQIIDCDTAPVKNHCHVRKWYFHWQIITWLTSKRGDLSSLMHLVFGDLGNFSFLCFCFPKSRMRVIILF